MEFLVNLDDAEPAATVQAPSPAATVQAPLPPTPSAKALPDTVQSTPVANAMPPTAQTTPPHQPAAQSTPTAMSPPPPTVIKRRGTKVGLFLKHTETESHPAIPSFTMVVGGRMEHAEVQQRVLESICQYERFRAAVIGDSFVEVEGAFSIADHVRPITRDDLQGEWPPTRERLRAFMERRFCLPMDPSKPMWEMIVAHGYRETDDRSGSEGGKTAVVARVHHVIVDGTAAGIMLGALSDEAKTDSILDEATKAMIDEKVRAIKASVTGGCNQLKVGLGITSVLCKYLHSWLFREEPASPFRGSTSGQRTLAWRAGIDCEASIEVARKHGCTLNDLWMSCLAHAMGSYMRSRHSKGLTSAAAGGVAAVSPSVTDGLELTAGLPVSLHPPILPPEVGNSSGNKFGFLLVRLPMEECDLVARLRRVHDVLMDAKSSPEALVSHQLARVTGCLPDALISSAVSAAGNSSTSTIMSNVRGPPKRLHINGSEVESITGFLPTPPGVALGVGLGTYAGSIGVSVTCDRVLLGDGAADELLQLMLQEHERYLQLREVNR